MASTPVQAGTKNDLIFQTFYPGNSQKVNTSAVAAQSATFETGVSVIRLFATKDCYVKFGTNPTATTSDMFIPSDIIQFVGVREGHKLSVIRDTEDGVLHIVEGDVV